MEKLNKGNVLTATNWNQLVDAARLAVKQVQTGGDVLEWTRQATIVRVRNDSGSDVSRFGVLGVKGGVAITPTDKLAEFQATPVLTTETLAATHAGKFVVAIEPIANGKIGRAVASGVVVCQVSVTTSGDAFAEAGTGVLTTGATGSALVLYVESGTGTKWAVVRIGDGGVGVIRGLAVKTGGIDGSFTSSTTCAYVYTIKDLSGTELATGQSPDRVRYPNCTYTVPAGDQPALLYVKLDGTWGLIDVLTERCVTATVTHIAGIRVTTTGVDQRPRECLVLDAKPLGNWETIHTGEQCP